MCLLGRVKKLSSNMQMRLQATNNDTDGQK